MHEATIAQSILDILVGRARSQSSTAVVRSAVLRVGAFRNIDPESLLFAFDSLKGIVQPCRNCKLEFDLILLTALCEIEEHLYMPSTEKFFCCTTCGAPMGRILSGNELEVVSVTLELPKEEASYA
jgi:Zn finger protein HypA/HybF involved in hydrogenase expression